MVGSLIRSSDIVARLDDDRVVAVLPRAPRGGAMHVAENICRAVQAKRIPESQTPAVTVSIGVATFPSCADNVYSLFDAADEALAWAQKNGRSQAVLAHPRTMPATRPVCAKAWFEPRAGQSTEHPANRLNYRPWWLSEIRRPESRVIDENAHWADVESDDLGRRSVTGRVKQSCGRPV